LKAETGGFSPSSSSGGRCIHIVRPILKSLAPVSRSWATTIAVWFGCSVVRQIVSAWARVEKPICRAFRITARIGRPAAFIAKSFRSRANWPALSSKGTVLPCLVTIFRQKRQ
jgi:hypothetical protein